MSLRKPTTKKRKSLSKVLKRKSKVSCHSDSDFWVLILTCCRHRRKFVTESKSCQIIVRNFCTIHSFVTITGSKNREIYFEESFQRKHYIESYASQERNYTPVVRWCRTATTAQHFDILITCLESLSQALSHNMLRRIFSQFSNYCSQTVSFHGVASSLQWTHNNFSITFMTHSNNNNLSKSCPMCEQSLKNNWLPH